MEEQVLSELIEFIREASPAVWEAARRQVLVNAIGCTFWAAFFMVVIVLAVKHIPVLSVRLDEASDWKEKETLYVIAVAALAILGFVGLFMVPLAANSAVGQFVNPDYYAIKVLLQLFVPQ